MTKEKLNKFYHKAFIQLNKMHDFASRDFECYSTLTMSENLRVFKDKRYSKKLLGLYALLPRLFTT